MWTATFGGQSGAARGGLADCQPLATRNERHHAARTALIRAHRAAIALAAYPIPTGQAVIVALRRAQRPVWAPGVRILGRPTIIRRRSRTSSIVDRAPIAWVRWGGPTERKRPPHRSLLRGVTGCPTPTTIVEQLHAQHDWVQAGVKTVLGVLRQLGHYQGFLGRGLTSRR